MKKGMPAFPTAPVEVWDGDRDRQIGSIPGHDGMTLRDYFAAQAMAALIEKTPLLVQTIGVDGSVSGVSDEFMRAHREGIAAGAFDYADAMLEAREK